MKTIKLYHQLLSVKGLRFIV